jgi:hypothetical protein
MIDQREYEAKLAEAVNKRGLDVLAKLTAVLRREFGADAANRMMKQIAPIVRQQGRGGRRESLVMKMAAIQPKPAA